MQAMLDIGLGAMAIMACRAWHRGGNAARERHCLPHQCPVLRAVAAGRPSRMARRCPALAQRYVAPCYTFNIEPFS
jgi:hypothetical protein